MKKVNFILIIFIIVFIALIAAIFFISKKFGFQKAQLPEDLLSDKLTEKEKEQAQELAELLYEDLRGLNLIYHDDEVYTEFLQLSDTMFVAVFNYFGIKDKKTLKEYIETDNFAFTGDEDFQTAILMRFQRLEDKGIDFSTGTIDLKSLM